MSPAKKRLPGGGGGRGRGGERAGREGITVVSAFEGYAFDAGMRAGDRITAINGKPVEGMAVDKVGGAGDPFDSDSACFHATSRLSEHRACRQ